MSDDALKHYSDTKADFISTYTPSLLASIPREAQRLALSITADALPFHGIDIWNAFEFSWLNNRGKPEVAVAQIRVPAQSANIIESKSVKLYLGSYSNTRFNHRSDLISTLESDLSLAANAPVSVILMSPEQSQHQGLSMPNGQSLDMLDIDIDEYAWNPEFLKLESDTIVKETLFTHLFRSVCPITSQPDFASFIIQYSGKRISQEGLLRYLISYREHAEFGEQIVERIFIDILNRLRPERLSIQARFTRRGGIDINACRSSQNDMFADLRMWRQ